MVYAYRNRLELAALCTLDEITDKTGVFKVKKNPKCVGSVMCAGEGIGTRKGLFDKCSKTQLRVKDDETILPGGITGFWSVNTAPLPLLDEKAFRQMCHVLGWKNGGTVAEVDTDTTARNFYSAKLSRYDQSVFILQNIYYPFAAFTQRNASGGSIWITPPEWIQLPEDPVRFLSPSELNRDWHGLCEDLSLEELEQIRYWKPQTVGEIIFNTWD